MTRTPAVHHCTSMPAAFFGRQAELGLLAAALAQGPESVVVFVGPGGQGKTAIVQHWLRTLTTPVDGVFLWSFYRGPDSDACLRAWLAYAESGDDPSPGEQGGAGGGRAGEVSASYCVDRLVERLRRERWAVVLDGTEVVQHETGAWRGRFLHPELGRLLETLAEGPTPGAVAVTTRFEAPTLTTRRHARIVSLGTLDVESGVALLANLGVAGDFAALASTHRAAGGHAKAVELTGTWLTRFRAGDASAIGDLPPLRDDIDCDEERHVLRVLEAFRRDLPEEMQDLVALATAFRHPPTVTTLLAYVASEPVTRLLREGWRRTTASFAERGPAALASMLDELIRLRLLERVSGGLAADGAEVVDAHPLVRRGFSRAGGAVGAQVRAGFLRGRPDRGKPASLAEAREEVELFHAYCDAGLWSEADGVLVGLDNPKRRFLAPAFERDLLLRFFPEGDWRRPPLWPGFGRWRSLAVCAEMLGQFEDAIAIYRPDDACLRGDALLALGRLDPLLSPRFVTHPWQSLAGAYRAHALALAGRSDEALAAALAAVPQDVYEWTHVFEALLRLGRLDAIDPNTLAAAEAAVPEEQTWTRLAFRRMRADLRRATDPTCANLDEWNALADAYDRAGLPIERVWVRLSHANVMASLGRTSERDALARAAAEIAERFAMPFTAADAEAIRSDVPLDMSGRASPIRT